MEDKLIQILEFVMTKFSKNIANIFLDYNENVFMIQLVLIELYDTEEIRNLVESFADYYNIKFGDLKIFPQNDDIHTVARMLDCEFRY